jgi:hypothetical protein
MLARLLDPFRGQAITTPPLDGALKPNNALDEAPVFAPLATPDNLVVSRDRLLASSGAQILTLGDLKPVETFDVPVTAMASLPDGGLAVGLDDGRILFRGGARHGQVIPHVGPDRLACPTALVADGGTLLVAQGSARHRASDWVADLMEKGASGSVWRLDGATHTRLADGLAFPYGLMVDGASVLVTEAWRHRILRIPEGGRPAPVLAKLAGYPARLVPAAAGGAWLALFAPRNRLIEFVLGEDRYRREMMRWVDRAHWIAPALRSGASFLEPLQCGGVRTMGVSKPWAPSRSYGLVVRLDAALQPVASFHSRASGLRHGVTALVEQGATLYVAAKGGDAVLALPRVAR